MHLIVGATGSLGFQICGLLTERGSPVRALARSTSNPTRVAALREMGAELAIGDLKDRGSLDAACRGASAVISTASSTLSRQEGDSIETVDRDGQLALIDAADAAGVERFVLVSFAGIDIEFPLQSAKRAAEERLARGRMTYAILQPTCFSDVWLGPALGFDVASATATIYGTGRNRTSWIASEDVARFAVAALDRRVAKAVDKLGGPEALSPLEVVQLAERITGRTFTVNHVPEEALREQYRAATDSMQRSFAALMLYNAGGDVIEMADTCRAYGVDGLKSVADHLRALAVSA
jgi:uncharacterized protein YbjT (DUF2867 family)